MTKTAIRKTTLPKHVLAQCVSLLALAAFAGCGSSATGDSVAPSAPTTPNLAALGTTRTWIRLLQRPAHNPYAPLVAAKLQRTWFLPPGKLKQHELLYITQWTYGPVLIYDVSGKKLDPKPVGSISAAAHDAAVDQKGYLYLSLYNQIARYAPGKSKPTLYEPDPNGVSDGVAVADDGTVYMADDHNVLVYEHGRTKPSYTIPNPAPSYGTPLDVAVDASGNAYVPIATEGASPIYEFAPGSIYGNQLPIENDWGAVFDEVDPQGNLILSNIGFTNIGGGMGPSIQAFRPGQGQPFATFDTGNYPGRIVLNHDANALFVEDVTPTSTFVVDEYAY